MSVLNVLVRRYRNLRNPANLKTVLGGFLALGIQVQEVLQTTAADDRKRGGGENAAR